MALFNREAYETLRVEERHYLLDNGWVQEAIELDEWDHEGHRRAAITQGHAVNIQKQYDRVFTQKEEPDGKRPPP